MNDYSRKIRIRIGAISIWLLLVIISIYIAYDYSISNLNYSPSQPLAFSHKAHSEKYGIKCTYCHYTAENSEHSNIPDLNTCMSCHIGVKNISELIEPLNISYDADSVIVWKRIYKLPDYVHFPHNAHIRANIDCSSCHGEVEKIDSMYLSTRLTMKWCNQCHENPQSFVTAPREISGIFNNKETYDGKLETISSKGITIPEYGKFFNQSFKSEQGINLPKTMGKGPTSCSACHY